MRQIRLKGRIWIKQNYIGILPKLTSGTPKLANLDLQISTNRWFHQQDLVLYRKTTETEFTIVAFIPCSLLCGYILTNEIKVNEGDSLLSDQRDIVTDAPYRKKSNIACHCHCEWLEFLNESDLKSQGYRLYMEDAAIFFQCLAESVVQYSSLLYWTKAHENNVQGLCELFSLCAYRTLE